VQFDVNFRRLNGKRIADFALRIRDHLEKRDKSILRKISYVQVCSSSPTDFGSADHLWFARRDSRELEFDPVVMHGPSVEVGTAACQRNVTSSHSMLSVRLPPTRYRDSFSAQTHVIAAQTVLESIFKYMYTLHKIQWLARITIVCSPPTQVPHRRVQESGRHLQ
jgi:hypothetical protein